jgi:hypothetical protein
LDPSIALTAGLKDQWGEDEDLKVKNAIEMDGGKSWDEIAALVPGRTKRQRRRRWYHALDPSIDLAIRHKGSWTEDEDLKLKKSVQMHGGKDWAAIAALVPSRTKSQCCSRCHDVLDPKIVPTAGRTGKWTEDEDSKLKDAVHTHGGKNWVLIATLVLGRTRFQCSNRWHDALDPSIALTAGTKGK